MSGQPYPTYRASEVPWVERLPEGWRTLPLYAVLRESKVSNVGMVEDNLLSLSYGQVVPKNIDTNDGLLPESFETYQIVEPGDIVFRFTDLQNDKRSLRSALVSERGIITSAYIAATPRSVTPEYAAYLMRSYDTTKVFYGLGGGVRQSLKFADVKRLPMILPSLGEQRAIADYLDRETSQIDALIAKQRKLIETLRDRRKSVLDGIASEAGEPATRLKYLYRESGVANHPGEEVLSVYRDYGVIPKSSRSDNFNRTPENIERYLLVQPGDLVINRMKAWQGSLGVSQHRGIVSGDYEVVRPVGDQLLPEFAHLYLRSARMVEQYKIRSSGIRPSQWRIYWAQTGMLEVPVPDKAVQRALVARASEQTEKIDTLIAKAERFVELASERRSAIVTAAVTGQIDVRGEVA